ncbi:MAG: hypothetical protein VB070_13850 [Clostridiaceae bacterium]|nr:hypothetical protein [Clostridiaceae bacterium]
MIYKPDFEEAKRYWQAFWQKEVLDRPVICVTAPKKNRTRPSYLNTPVLSYKSCMNSRFDTLLQEYDAYAAATYFGGEAVPAFDITLGPDQYAGFLGVRIEAHDGYDTTWAQPMIKDWTDYSVRIDRSPGGYFDQVMKYYRYAADFARDRFLLNMLDLHSNMDALSALRGPENLCIDLMDCPDEVHRALDAVRSTYPEIVEMPYTAGDMANRGSTGWSPTYCENGRFAVVQCDFSCMISPAQAREFVIPAIGEEAAYLDRCVYHYDGKEALGHLDDILAIPDIDVIQWVPGDGNPRSIEWMELLHKIQKAGKGLWIYDWTVDEIKKRFKELKPEGLVFSVSAGSEAEAENLLSYVKDHM